MSYLAILDPYTVIWNKEDFIIDSTKYYSIAANLIELIETLEREKPLFLLRKEMIDEMTDGFPACELSGTFPQLRDINYTFFNFISKIGNDIVDFPPKIINGLYSDPNLIKPFLNQNVENEINYLITQISLFENSMVFFTIEGIWEGEDELRIISDTHNKIISVKNDNCKLKNFFESIKLNFEENPKHNELGGWDSKLTTTINIVKKLLESAIDCDNNSNALYNYCNEDNVFIVFRPHLPNIYHAYPAKINQVPAKVKKRLIDSINDIGKRGKILKSK